VSVSGGGIAVGVMLGMFGIGCVDSIKFESMYLNLISLDERVKQ